jgi:hypothetical protein
MSACTARIGTTKPLDARWTLIDAVDYARSHAPVDYGGASRRPDGVNAYRASASGRALHVQWGGSGLLRLARVDSMRTSGVSLSALSSSGRWGF